MANSKQPSSSSHVEKRHGFSIKNATLVFSTAAFILLIPVILFFYVNISVLPTTLSMGGFGSFLSFLVFFANGLIFRC